MGFEDAYIVDGGHTLKGYVNLSGAKNVALKVIIASLLFDNEVYLENIPQIRDVMELIHLVRELGVRVKFVEDNTLYIDPRTLKKNKVSFLHASKIRVSFMLLVPLMLRFPEVFVPNPGGCRIGARPIDRVIEGLQALGATIDYNSESGYYRGKLISKIEGYYRFSKPTHTGTETLILLAAFTGSEVVIDNAAMEPEIDELIRFLNQAGASIVRDGEKIRVSKRKIKKLIQKRPFRIGYDRNEAITYAALAGVTKGQITISPIEERLIKRFILEAKKAGVGVKKDRDGWTFFYNGTLKPVSIETSPYPGFMTDWQPLWAVMMTQADGTSFISERIFENRFSYIPELSKLGAQIKFVDKLIKDPERYYFFNYQRGKKYNQTIEIKGITPLHNGVLELKDLRAGATLLVAALSAPGESVVKGARILERGYENVVKKMRAVGARIKKV